MIRIVAVLILASLSRLAVAQVVTVADVTEADADTLLAHEDYQTALTTYSTLIDKHKASSMSYYKRAMCYYSLGQFEKALSDVRTFVSKNSGFPQAYLLEAYIGKSMEDDDVQLEGLDPLLKLEPDNNELLHWRVSLYMATDKFEEARKDIAVLKRAGDDAELELYQGVTYYYEDKADSALTCFDKAIRLDQNYTTPYLYASSLCLDHEAYPQALDYANKGLRLEPDNVSMIFYKGIALIEMDHLDTGCSLLNKAFRNGEDDAAGYLKEYCFGVDGR